MVFSSPVFFMLLNRWMMGSFEILMISFLVRGIRMQSGSSCPFHEDTSGWYRTRSFSFQRSHLGWSQLKIRFDKYGYSYIVLLDIIVVGYYCYWITIRSLLFGYYCFFNKITNDLIRPQVLHACQTFLGPSTSRFFVDVVDDDPSGGRVDRSQPPSRGCSH